MRLIAETSRQGQISPIYRPLQGDLLHKMLEAHKTAITFRGHSHLLRKNVT
jgi:hypothetical protein